MLKKLNSKKYKVIYADPPWKYYNERTGGSLSSGASQKYPVLSLEEICQLPVSDIADKDAVLFLWATVPMLEDAFKVISAWGFKYKTAVFWKKVASLGMGYWFRGQVEVCLIGVRGKIKPFRLQIPNIIESKPSRHSEKPEEMRKLIEAIGLQPRVELFARKRVEGWDCWGNEVESDCLLEPRPLAISTSKRAEFTATCYNCGRQFKFEPEWMADTDLCPDCADGTFFGELAEGLIESDPLTKP